MKLILFLIASALFSVALFDYCNAHGISTLAGLVEHVYSTSPALTRAVIALSVMLGTGYVVLSIMRRER